MSNIAFVILVVGCALAILAVLLGASAWVS